MNDLYVYADPEGRYSALPISVAVGNYDCHEAVDGTNLEEQINTLAEEEHFKFLHLFVQPGEINALGYRDVMRRKIELLIPKFIVQNKIKEPRVLYAQDIPKSNYYNSTTSEVPKDLKELLEGLCYYKREARVTNLINFYPDYGWSKNRGVLDDYEVKEIVKRGVITNQHYLEALRLVPYMWLNAIERLDLDYYSLQDIVKNPPHWWVNSFGGVGILETLSRDYVKAYDKCVRANYPEEFKRFLQHSYGKLA